MACGLPIISTDLPGVRDYVNDECAVLTPRGDPRALVDAVLSLRDNREKLQGMALASRKHSMNFSWQIVASEIKKVYRSVSMHLCAH